MHKLQCRTARPELRSFVRAYAQREIRGVECPIIEPIPARLEQTLEFQFGNSFDLIVTSGDRIPTPVIAVIGFHGQGGFTISLGNNVTSFGIFFQPAGFSRLFGIPMAELSNHAFDAADVLGPEIVPLGERLAGCRSFDERAIIADTALLARAALVSNSDRDLTETAAAYIFRARGALRVDAVAARFGLSLRQFERRFTRKTGVRPKTFTRVARFQSALDAKISGPHCRWLDIAHDLGYHDQMHMIHDFHDLAGDAPGRILSLIGDGRPPAMLEHTEFT